MFGRFVHLTLVSLFASVALVPTTSARMLDETPARLEALAVRAAEAETDAQFEIESQEAEQEDVPSRLLGTTTHQALIADSAFLSARNAYKNNHKKALDELSQQVKGYPLAGYVELWQLLLRTKNNPNDSSVLSDMRRFIAAHEGEYLGERARGEAARCPCRRHCNLQCLLGQTDVAENRAGLALFSRLNDVKTTADKRGPGCG